MRTSAYGFGAGHMLGAEHDSERLRRVGVASGVVTLCVSHACTTCMHVHAMQKRAAWAA